MYTLLLIIPQIWIFVYDLHQLRKGWTRLPILCLVRGTHNPMIHVYSTCYSRNNVHACSHKRAFSITYRTSARPKHGNPLISMKYNMGELSSWLWNAHFCDIFLSNVPIDGTPFSIITVININKQLYLITVAWSETLS